MSYVRVFEESEFTGISEVRTNESDRRMVDGHHKSMGETSPMLHLVKMVATSYRPTPPIVPQLNPAWLGTC